METDSCIRFLQVLLLTCRIIKFLWKNRQSQRIISTAISTVGYVVICERDKLKVILKHDARSKLRSGLLSHLTHLKFQVMNKLYPTLYKSENIRILRIILISSHKTLSRLSFTKPHYCYSIGRENKGSTTKTNEKYAISKNVGKQDSFVLSTQKYHLLYTNTLTH